MDIVNAIAKVRFGSAKPQRIVLHKGDSGPAELLCLESGQKVQVKSGQWCYYVITSKATLTTNGTTIELPMGQFAATEKDEPHTLSNDSEERLICLAFGQTA